MRKLKTNELNRINIESFKKAKKKPLTIVLDNIRSLNNIGSVFRTADAFRVEQIFLCGITARPPHREIQKTALGATASVSWKYFEDINDAVKELKEHGYKIIALEQADESINLHNFTPENDRKYALVFGNEVNGVSEAIVKTADYCLEIPQFGTKHSFNVTVSAGIAIWDMLFKMKLLDE
jgi:23S rRNA (guanosine2251-2'-O)-methyltransferase